MAVAGPDRPYDTRGQYIPTRKRVLFDALLTDLNLTVREGDAPERLYQLLMAMIHQQYLGELEQLHNAYYLLDPANRVPATPDERDRAYSQLSTSLEHVLERANFTEVSTEIIEMAATQSGRIRYPVRNAIADFRAIRLFNRGQHSETIERTSLYGLRKKRFDINVYDEVVLLAALKSTDPPPTERKVRKRRRPRPAPPGSVMIKCFHDIAVADLDALYPEVRVVMTTADKLTLGLPALVAGIPLLIKLAPAFFVLYGLLRFYFGDPAPGQDGIGEALIVASGILALGGFLMNQWMKYERRSLLYQREVNDMIYFHNVTNNVGMFDHIIGSAEEQECKEALLAYFFLLVSEQPMSQATLDERIEIWLRDRFALDVDFEVDDALRKLDRLGLLNRLGDRLAVVPLAGALRELDRRWDGIFDYAGTSEADAA